MTTLLKIGDKVYIGSKILNLTGVLIEVEQNKYWIKLDSNGSLYGVSNKYYLVRSE